MAIVSFKPQGRLGNFLFTLATVIAYAKKHGLEYCTPSKTNNNYWNPIYDLGLSNSLWINQDPDIIVNEKVLYKYDELPFEESWRGKKIQLIGYFQNPKYFQSYREDILNSIKLPYVYMEGFVAVHIRRGDYVNLREKHPEVTVEWYKNAMSLFPNYYFKFFSDDIEWCKKTFGEEGKYLYSERENELSDLIKMSWCEHQICSASTFSWWGAYLNKNIDKKCIFPKQWLTPSHSNEWTEEIVPKEWLRI